MRKSALALNGFPAPAELVTELKKTPGLLYTDEPGFAHDFRPPAAQANLWPLLGLAPLALSAGGLAALGLSAQAPQQNSNKTKKKKPKPKTEKRADWKDLLQKIREQLPGLHTPDLVAGSALGAGGGLLYDLIRGQSDDERARSPRWRTRLRRALTGALLGGATANLAGDRARRYISNTLLPFGYDAKNLKNVMPDSWRKVWRAGVLDQPAYDPKSLKDYAGHRSAALPARRELMRRTFGVHTDNPLRDWWQRNQDGTYSLNEGNSNYQQRLRELFGPSNRMSWLSHIVPIMQNPEAVLKDLNTNNPSNMARDDQFDFFSTSQILGAQQIPHKRVGDTIYGQVLDRFDLTPGAKEEQHLRAWLGAKLWPFGKNKAWLQSKLPFERKAEGMIGTNYHYVEDGVTNDQMGKTVAARWLWDRVLSKEKPWVSQKFRLDKLPEQRLVFGDGSEYGSDFNVEYVPVDWEFSLLKNRGTPAKQFRDATQLKSWVEAPPPDTELTLDGFKM